MLPQIGVPLKNQELEDIIIYLGSLGKQNVITTEVLASTYKQWSLAQQKSTILTAKECACAPQPLPWEPAWLSPALHPQVAPPSLACYKFAKLWSFQPQRPKAQLLFCLFKDEVQPLSLEGHKLLI